MEAVTWLVAVAVLVSGAVALALVLRRVRCARRAARIEAPLPAASLAPDEAPEKICPACGSRYAAGYRTCARDQSDLAALH